MMIAPTIVAAHRQSSEAAISRKILSRASRLGPK
jgi:hypothetical protein